MGAVAVGVGEEVVEVFVNVPCVVVDLVLAVDCALVVVCWDDTKGVETETNMEIFVVVTTEV